jgi:hypothetical protein
MQSFLLFSSLAFGFDDYNKLEQYLEKLDKPSDNIELLNIKNIDYLNNSGYVCTYKNELDDQYDYFLNIFKNQRQEYKKCNFSSYLVYLFDEKEFNDNLINVIQSYDYKKIDTNNYIIQDNNNPKQLTIAFICKNCKNSGKMIKRNINKFLFKTCVLNKPDKYSKSTIDYLKRLTNSVSRKDRNDNKE